jgi:hypothetical protein
MGVVGGDVKRVGGRGRDLSRGGDIAIANYRLAYNSAKVFCCI